MTHSPEEESCDWPEEGLAMSVNGRPVRITASQPVNQVVNQVQTPAKPAPPPPPPPKK